MLKKLPSAADATPPESAAPRRLDGTYKAMDAARAVAACAVVFSHSRDLLLADATKEMGTGTRLFYAVSGLGHEAVMVFFVLSGYWIVRSVVMKANPAKSFWPSYLVDRLTRLWIVLLPALIVGGLSDSLGLAMHLPVYKGATGAHSIPSIGISLSVLDLIGNLMFLQTLAVPAFGSNGPLWSLAYEFWFYLWFPSLWLVIRFGKPTVPLLSIVMMWLYPTMALSFLSWLVGGAVLAIFHVYFKQALRPRIGQVFTVVGATASVIAVVSSRSMYHGPVADLAVSGCFGLMLLGMLLRPLGNPGRLLRPIAYFGSSGSFSLYAIHFPLLALMAGGIKERYQPSLGAMLLVVGATALAVFMGWIFSIAFESRTSTVRSIFRRLML